VTIREFRPDGTLEALCALLREHGAPDFIHYQGRSVRDGITRRVAEAGGPSPADYLALCHASEGERHALIDAISINYSLFFRGPCVFDAITERLVAQLRQAVWKRSRPLRIWCAGCAAGEEPYSLAILLAEALGGQRAREQVLLFATDVDHAALQSARLAVYSRHSLNEVRLAHFDTYFEARGVDHALRVERLPTVHFSLHDLSSDQLATPPDSIFGGFDLVLCRHVLIYFEPSLRRAVTRKLHQALVPGGLLVLGDSESPSDHPDAQFDILDSDKRIFRKTRST